MPVMLDDFSSTRKRKIVRDRRRRVGENLSVRHKALAKSPLQIALQLRMKERGVSMRSLSLKAGLGPSAVKQIMQGVSVSPRWATLEALSKALGYETVYDMLAGGADGTVPLIGAAGAGDIIVRFHADGSLEPIAAPRGMAHGACVVVRGDSMLPVYRDGDLLFFDRPHEEHEGGVAPHAVRRDCVVEAEDGTMYVKTVLQAGRKGFYNLASYNRPDVIADVRVRWAAPVLWVKRG